MGTALDIVWRALKDPEKRALLVQFAQQLLDGKREYDRLHWGRSGEGPTTIELPEDGPLVQLGALASISYITQKGPADRKPVQYVHTFKTPLPWLYKNADGDLLIVRGRSRYTVRTHGIIG